MRDLLHSQPHCGLPKCNGLTTLRTEHWMEQTLGLIRHGFSKQGFIYWPYIQNPCVHWPPYKGLSDKELLALGIFVIIRNLVRIQSHTEEVYTVWNRDPPVHCSGGAHGVPYTASQLLLLWSLISDKIIDQKQTYLKPEKELHRTELWFAAKGAVAWNWAVLAGTYLMERQAENQAGLCMLRHFPDSVYKLGYAYIGQLVAW